MALIYVVAVILGQALGYALVRLFLWAWPSLWGLGWSEGRRDYRATYELIMNANPKHSRLRAAFYAFIAVGEMRGAIRRAPKKVA